MSVPVLSSAVQPPTGASHPGTRSRGPADADRPSAGGVGFYRMRRKRWIGLTVAWLVCLTGWGAAALLPNRYVSEADIYVRWSPALARDIGPAAAGTTPQAAIHAALTRAPTLGRLLLRMDPETAVSGAAARQALLERWRRGIRLTSPAPDLYRVRFELAPEGRTPAAAAREAQATLAMLLNLFVEEAVRLDSDSMRSAAAFLDGRIAEAHSGGGRPAVGNAAQRARLEAAQASRRDELVRARAELLAREVEPAADQVQFQIVRAPTPARVSTSPDRPLLFLLVLLGGIAAGVFASLAAGRLSRTFVSPGELAQTFHLPVLASISEIERPADRRRASVLELGFIGLAAALCLAGLLLTGVALLAPQKFA